MAHVWDGEQPLVLLAGAPWQTAGLSARLKAGVSWPQALGLVDLGEALASAACSEAQCLSAWRAQPHSGRWLVCVLLATSPSGCAEAQASTHAWRLALADAAWPHAVLHGDESAQREAALAVVLHAWARWQAGPAPEPVRKWRWVCEDCDDGDCEQHWLPGAGKAVP